MGSFAGLPRVSLSFYVSKLFPRCSNPYFSSGRVTSPHFSNYARLGAVVFAMAPVLLRSGARLSHFKLQGPARTFSPTRRRDPVQGHFFDYLSLVLPRELT